MSNTAASSNTADLLRPRDTDALRAATRSLASGRVAPVLFAGEVVDDTLRLTEFSGTRTNSLRGLSVASSSGLGGRAVAQRGPVAVRDYGRAVSITHHYDAPVLTEGLRSIVAVPVVVRGHPRAVLYAATRQCISIGTRITDPVFGAARALATEIETRDEVDRRVRLLAAAAAERTSGVRREELRDLHSELRAVARDADDPSLAARVQSIASRLARLTHPGEGEWREGSREQGNAPTVDVTLSARELDVLAHVALGCTNRDVAERLSVGAETVKSYLRSVMAKLDVHTRQQAVVAARRRGLLP
ncbi:LuxR C-terminal-related transcriptional regulator [Rhodococcus sp. HNM0569]|uniref:LuxR C-terminal-related transcriptional regulator n=1 Tax=Rhodococcus sp. HNM0569 TaxID=2716340 RepID=UPI003211DF33